MRVRPINRREAIRLGVIKPETEVKGMNTDFAETEIARTSISPEAQKVLRRHYGSVLSAAGGKLKPVQKRVTEFPAGHLPEDIPTREGLEKQLKPEQFSALESYTTHEHMLMNRLLRTGTLPAKASSRTKEAIENKIKEATRGIQKYSGFSGDTVLYRATHLPSDLLEDVLEKGQYQDKAFLSTTFDPSGEITRPAKLGEVTVLMKINVPKGTKGMMPVENLSTVPEQLEVLFKPSAIFSVEDYNGTVLTLNYEPI